MRAALSCFGSGLSDVRAALSCFGSGLSDVRAALSCFGSALGSCVTAAWLKHQESDALRQYPCCG